MRISLHHLHHHLLPRAGHRIRRGIRLPPTGTALTSFSTTYAENGHQHEEEDDFGGDGASMVFVIRHAERLDRQDPNWSALALRPQDTPLSETGKHQAKRLGKW